MKRVVIYNSDISLPIAKLFFVLLFSVVFTLLSIFNIAANRVILVKEATEAEKEECKVENESISELCNIFGFKRAKLGKKSSPPDSFPTLTSVFIGNFSFLFSGSFFLDKVDSVTSRPYDIFSNTPRYIAFHSLIFYEA